MIPRFLSEKHDFLIGVGQKSQLFIVFKDFEHEVGKFSKEELKAIGEMFLKAAENTDSHSVSQAV